MLLPMLTVFYINNCIQVVECTTLYTNTWSTSTTMIIIKAALWTLIFSSSSQYEYETLPTVFARIARTHLNRLYLFIYFIYPFLCRCPFILTFALCRRNVIFMRQSSAQKFFHTERRKKNTNKLGITRV